MVNLKQKIKKTTLFAPDEKVDILTSIDTFSQHDLTELESILDEYDDKCKEILVTFRQNMVQELDNIQKNSPNGGKAQMKEAVKKIKSGLDVIVAPSTA